MQQIIRISNLNKNFGKRKILYNFNLDVYQGNMLAIMGPSGSGKSTLLNIIGLIDDFESGDYKLIDEINIKVNSIKSQKMIRDHISYLFQNFALINSETVTENLLIALKYKRASKLEKIKIIRSALEEVGLSNYEKMNIYELSGGEQQRVAIARALIKPGELILADEPTGSLDIENRDKIMGLLHKANKMGKTVIIVTHDPEVASQTDRIIELV